MVVSSWGASCGCDGLPPAVPAEGGLAVSCGWKQRCPKMGGNGLLLLVFSKHEYKAESRSTAVVVCQTHIFMFSSSVASSLHIYMFPRRLEVGNREENSIGNIVQGDCR